MIGNFMIPPCLSHLYPSEPVESYVWLQAQVQGRKHVAQNAPGLFGWFLGLMASQPTPHNVPPSKIRVEFSALLRETNC